MTENLTQRIIQFLETDTNYALLIRGDYGIGKTYYIKNELFPRVRKTVVPTSIIDENYHPVLISLFGIRNVDEIKEQLFLELFPLLKNENVIITPNVGIFLTKMFCKLDTKRFINNEDTSSSKVIRIKNILLCFDDINLKSDALQSKELFGFISNILENSNIKIILIENELNKAETTYSVIREKVIGPSIKFNTNVPLVYKQIITTKYKEKLPSYFNFLNEQSKDVISKIEENNSNLRTLIFILDHYEIIYTSLEEFFENDEEPKYLEKECFNSTFNFAISISIVFKMGKLTPNLIFGLKQEYNVGQILNTPFDGDLHWEASEEAGDYIEKYLSNINYQPIEFFNSIFDYITGSSSFIIENLVRELKPCRIINRYPIFDKLFELEGLDLSMSEIEYLIDEMLNLVDNAEFNLNEYPNVFAVVTRFFDTPGRVNINDRENKAREKLVKRFKKGIDKWAQHYDPLDYPEYNVNLAEGSVDKERIHFSSPFKREGRKLSVFRFNFNTRPNEIGKYCREVYYKIKTQNEKKEIKSLYDLYKKDIITFIEKISEPNTNLRYYPIYSKFNFKEFWSIFKKAKNSQLVEFGFHLEQRYQSPFLEYLDSDRHFLLTLLKKLQREREKLTQNPLLINFDTDVIDYLSKELDKVIDLLKE